MTENQFNWIKLLADITENWYSTWLFHCIEGEILLLVQFFLMLSYSLIERYECNENSIISENDIISNYRLSNVHQFYRVEQLLWIRWPDIRSTSKWITFDIFLVNIDLRMAEYKKMMRKYTQKQHSNGNHFTLTNRNKKNQQPKCKLLLYFCRHLFSFCIWFDDYLEH